jgi:hypothetical protein
VAIECAPHLDAVRVVRSSNGRRWATNVHEVQFRNFTPEGRLRRGRILVTLSANGRMKDLVGSYRARRGSKYFKGPQRPRLADLSDSELVIYGP